MPEAYEYRSFVPAGTWSSIPDNGRAGLWTAEIGGWSNTSAWLTCGGRVASPPDVTVTSAERLEATARPETPGRLDLEPGVYAHRWFEIDDADWPEFLALSTAAWPAFESAYPGTEILGLFRSLDTPPPLGRVLLVTRYPSLAVWEQSRGVSGETRAAFARRHQLTRRTSVTTWRPVRSGGA